MNSKTKTKYLTFVGISSGSEDWKLHSQRQFNTIDNVPKRCGFRVLFGVHSIRRHHVYNCYFRNGLLCVLVRHKRSKYYILITELFFEYFVIITIGTIIQGLI